MTDEIIKQSNQYLTKFLHEGDKNKVDANRYNFHNNWNDLMLVVEEIENRFDATKITIHLNYCRFEFEKDSIQDKEIDKINAVYSVCIQVLNRKWKPSPFNMRTTEPFGLDDLD